jgi:uncharacterized membrane protein
MEHPEHAHQAFTPDILKRIAHNIADVEEATGADIRISIRDLREAGEADLSVKELAEKEFAMLGMHRKDGFGILLLILYHERKFYVCGDAGVHSKVHPETWKDVAGTLGAHFAKGDYEGGLKEALKKIEHHLDGKLKKHTSVENRTSDEVAIR